MSQTVYEVQPPSTQENMSIQELLHYLRNPWGHSEQTIREARLLAADLIDNAVSTGGIPVTLRAA